MALTTRETSLEEIIRGLGALGWLLASMLQPHIESENKIAAKLFQLIIRLSLLPLRYRKPDMNYAADPAAFYTRHDPCSTFAEITFRKARCGARLQHYWTPAAFNTGGISHAPSAPLSSPTTMRRE